MEGFTNSSTIHHLINATRKIAALQHALDRQGLACRRQGEGEEGVVLYRDV